MLISLYSEQMARGLFKDAVSTTEVMLHRIQREGIPFGALEQIRQEAVMAYILHDIQLGKHTDHEDPNYCDTAEITTVHFL
jgi:hypothetical protein